MQEPRVESMQHFKLIKSKTKLMRHFYANKRIKLV